MTTLRNAFNPLLHWRPTRRQLGPIFVGLLFLALLGGGTLTAIRLLRATTPTALLPGQMLAWELAAAIEHDEIVQSASGAYLPNDRIILYTKVARDDRTFIRQWAALQLEPYTSRLATLPPQEELTWIIDLATAPPSQEILTVPLDRAADPTLYTYMSAGPLTGTVEAGASTTTSTTIDPATASTAALNTNKPTADGVTEPQAEPPAAVGADAIATVAEHAVTPTVDRATPLRSLAFDGDGGTTASEWRPISGAWTANDGMYSQQDMTGYDYITMLDLPAQSHFSMEAQLRMRAGEMGGGFIYNAPTIDNRAGAQIIDMDDGGRFLRWGHYDAAGNYSYDGGAPLEVGLDDGEWHTLQLITHGAQSTVLFDGKELGQPDNLSTVGFLGLVTSRAQVAFDDLVIMALPAIDAPAAMDGNEAITASVATAAMTAITTTAFRDDFADGNRKGWRVLNGTWQFTDGLYQQNNADGSDMGAISTFQSDQYRVTVRTRLLEGSMGAGLYFNMAEREANMRSQIVSYTADGNQIQWGSFDDGGNFVLQGLADVPTGGDGAWHTLSLQVESGSATIAVDDVAVAEAIALTYVRGYVGLFANHSKVAFDDFEIVPLGTPNK